MAPDEKWCLSAAFFEALPLTAAIVDADGFLLLATPGAERLLRCGSVLLDGGRLRFSCEQTNALLDGVIGSESPEGVPPGKSFPLPRNHGDPPMLIQVAQVATGATRAFLLIIHELGHEQRVDPTLLESLFCLTRAEARVAAAISQGCDLAAISEKSGLSPATIRAQLKSVFRKLGVRRQQDLVRLLTETACACRNPIN